VCIEKFRRFVECIVFIFEDNHFIIHGFAAPKISNMRVAVLGLIRCGGVVVIVWKLQQRNKTILSHYD
jgi:hypothetical protein